MKFILGKKVNMTQIWEQDKVMAVTKVQAGPCFITQVKEDKNDSYQALQVAYGQKKNKNISKPLRGHLAKAGIKEGARYLREFRLNELKPEMKIGAVIDVSTFTKGDIVDVSGTSKGKGFQGLVRRYGFRGHKSSHGNKDQERTSGSVGAKGPARIFPGRKMPGRMGGGRVSVKNLEIMEVDLDNNVLYIKGGLPGSENGLLIIKGVGDLVVKDQAPLLEAFEANSAEIEEEKKEEKVEEIKEEEVKEEEK